MFLLLICFGVGLCNFCFSQDRIEINLDNKEVRLLNFNLGGYKISGIFFFDLEQEGGSLIVSAVGRNIIFQNKNIAWLKMELAKAGDVIFIRKLSIPQFSADGDIDLGERKLALNIKGSWYETSQFLQGQINTEAKVWGEFGKFLTSGTLTVENGVYEGSEFAKLRIDFIGTPPVMNITDSEVVLYDGSVFDIKGVINLADFENFMPDAEFATEKIFIDEWQPFFEGKESFGLKKHVDEKLDVFLATKEDENADLETGAELRYRWKGDNFLKLRMESDQSILGFERRKDF